jgi:hypothetical protein
MWGVEKARSRMLPKRYGHSAPMSRKLEGRGHIAAVHFIYIFKINDLTR